MSNVEPSGPAVRTDWRTKFFAALGGGGGVALGMLISYLADFQSFWAKLPAVTGGIVVGILVARLFIARRSAAVGKQGCQGGGGGSEREDRLRPNEIDLFGQRFHASVGFTYIGLGFIFSGAIHRWFADGAAWLSPIGLLMLFVGVIWWVALWSRQRKAA